MRSVALALAAMAHLADAKPCTNATYIEQFEHRGDDAVACNNTDERQCWRIDKRGQITELPKTEWPVPPPAKAGFPYAEGDHLLGDANAVDGVQLRAPDGVDLRVHEQKIDVCIADRCRSLVVKPRSKGDDLTEVTVLPDKHTVFVGTGPAVVTNERLLRFDLDHPDAGRLIGRCATVWDAFPGGNVLIQKSDCANAGGPRLLVSPAGRILAEIGGQFSMTKGEYHVGGDLWFFVDYDTFAVWDVRRARVVAKLGACPP